MESGLRENNMQIMARILSLAESNIEQDQSLLNNLILKSEVWQKRSIRIAISGPPGAGKSTFIDALLKQRGNFDSRIAVLAIDPSSEVSKGSILGDKTRMEHLIQDDKVFVRPVASGREQGGVAAATKKSILICEAGGYNTIILETVGVGQSAFEASKLVDFFILVLSPAAGDELQGIKRGIVEMADMIVVNKDDDALKSYAKLTQDAYKNALHLLPNSDWNVPVLKVSSKNMVGFDEVWEKIFQYFESKRDSASFKENRIYQDIYWFKKDLANMLMNHFYQKNEARFNLKELMNQLENSGLHYLDAIESIRKQLNNEVE